MKVMLEIAGLRRIINVEKLLPEIYIAIREDIQVIASKEYSSKIAPDFKRFILRYKGRRTECPCCKTEFYLYEYVGVQ